jgi:hypothetical protein
MKITKQFISKATLILFFVIIGLTVVALIFRALQESINF